MDNDIFAFIDEFIKLEMSVSDIYMLFNKLFPEDADFWWELAMEEKNHAALLRSGEGFLEVTGKFPLDLLAPELQELKDTNIRLDSLNTKFQEMSPSRQEAFNIAFEIENMAGELHFQEFMERNSSTEIARIFKELNKDDKDHAARIRDYMEEHGISIQSKE